MVKSRFIYAVIVSLLVLLFAFMGATFAMKAPAMAAELTTNALSVQGSLPSGVKQLETYEINGNGSKSYTVGNGVTAIPVKTSQAGYASMQISVSGTNDVVEVDLYDANLNQVILTKGKSTYTRPISFGSARCLWEFSSARED